MAEGNGSNRLDRIERLLEHLAERQEADHAFFMAEQKALLKVMQDEREEARRQREAVKAEIKAEREARLEADKAERDARIEADRARDERIDKLVSAIGEFVRRLPPPPSAGNSE